MRVSVCKAHQATQVNMKELAAAMSTNYQYRSIEIKNFRSFKKLSLPKLKRINIFGGFNGVGKTSLLEVIFFTMDVANPIALIKPYMWRGVSPRDAEDLFYLLEDEENVASVTTDGVRGRVEIQVNKRSTPSSAIAARNSGLRQTTMDMRTSDSFGKFGLQIDAKWANEKVSNFLFPDFEGYSGSSLQSSNPQLPQAVILRTGVRGTSNETATRLSSLIRSKRINRVIEPLKMFQPDLRNFQILQNGNEHSIYADIDGNLSSVNMLGDGFRNLFEVILAIGVARDGCVFLDEIDASFHYSIVADAWKAISQTAAAENCQVFATSHSRETILSAAEGIQAAGREKDFNYSRMSKFEERHVVTSYDVSELDSADEFNIEFR